MWWTALLLVLACAYRHVLTLSDLTDEYNEVLLASDYHFRELKRNVERLHFLEQHMDEIQIQKRGTQANLMSSLLIFCDSLNHPDRYHLPVTGTSITDTDDTENQVEVSRNRNNKSSVDSRAGSEPRHWYQPGANPVRVEISTSGNVVEMKFDVVSNSTVRIVRETTIRSTSSDSIDDRTIVPSPNHGARVTFSFPESQCDVYNKEEISFHTPSKHKLKWDHATLVLTPCRSLKYHAESLQNPSRVQNIIFPQFRVLNHNRDIHVAPGKNTTIEVEVNLNETYFFLSAMMFDHFEKRLLLAETIINMAYDEDTVTYHYYVGEYAQNVLTMEEINTTDTINKEVAEANDTGKHFLRKFRATVNTESGYLSGIVIIGASLDFPGNSLVKMSSCSTSLTITTSQMTEPLPRGQFIFRNETHFACKPGYRHFLNGNCYLDCFVTGRDITSMTIRKKDPPFPKTVSAMKTKFVTYGTQATGRLTVGPGDPDKDGEYLCVVGDSKGYTASLTLHLISSGFAEVDKNNSGIEDLGNASVLIKCSAQGRAPLKTAIYLDGRSESDRIDTQFHKSIEVSDEMDSIFSEIIVPKATVQWPKHYVICQVDNGIDRDEEMFYISDFITDYQPHNNYRTSTSSYYQH